MSSLATMTADQLYKAAMNLSPGPARNRLLEIRAEKMKTGMTEKHQDQQLSASGVGSKRKRNDVEDDVDIDSWSMAKILGTLTNKSALAVHSDFWSLPSLDELINTFPTSEGGRPEEKMIDSEPKKTAMDVPSSIILETRKEEACVVMGFVQTYSYPLQTDCDATINVKIGKSISEKF
jgi:hypothetical protein